MSGTGRTEHCGILDSWALAMAQALRTTAAAAARRILAIYDADTKGGIACRLSVVKELSARPAQ